MEEEINLINDFKKKKYEPLHPEVYNFNMDYVDPRLRAALEADKSDEGAILNILTPRIPGLFSFPCLNLDFCNKFSEELVNLQRKGVSSMREPNSMNKYGALLNTLGFKPFFDDLLAQLVVPIARLLYKEQGGPEMRHHHSFTVKYQPGGDVKLDLHSDNSDMTLNICLTPNNEFTGGNLFFKGLQPCSIQRLPASMHRYKKEEQLYEIEHEQGVGLIHLGKHVHGAYPITSGSRTNIIVWCKKEPFNE